MELFLENFIKLQTRVRAKDVAAAFRLAIEEAKKQKEPVTLVLPKNQLLHVFKDRCAVRTFPMSNTDSIDHVKKSFGILLEDMENVTIDGQGAKILFHGDLCAIGVVRCKNITLKDFSWDFSCPTTSQMTVVDSTPHTVTFEPAKGCPVEIEGRNAVWIGEQSPYTGARYYVEKNNHKSYHTVAYSKKAGTVCRCSFHEFPFQRIRRIESISSKQFKVHYFGWAPKIWRQKGMIAELCASKERPTAGAFFWESENLQVENLTVHYMHGFGWLSQMCKDIRFSHCQFVPNEEDGRYCTSYADLIHMSGVGGHVEIEKCTFSHAHDDPINIHGTFTRVEKRIDAHTATLRYVHQQQGGFRQFHEGDEVLFYRRDDLSPLGQAEKAYTVVASSAPLEDGNDAKTMTVTFKEALPDELFQSILGEPAFVAENVTYTPSVHIADCVFRHIPTRAILCTTRKKVCIERNFFDNIAMAAIFISNDSNEWYESGPVRDMTIRQNEFYIRPSAQKEWKDTPAIYVHPVVKSKSLPKVPVHQNIRILDNVIHLFHDKAFVLESVDGLTISGNTVIEEEPLKKPYYKISACAHVDSDLT